MTDYLPCKTLLSNNKIPTNINNIPTMNVYCIPKILEYHTSGKLDTHPKTKIIKPTKISTASKSIITLSPVHNVFLNDYLHELFSNIKNKSLAFNFIAIFDNIMEVCLSNMNCFPHSIFRGNLLPFTNREKEVLKGCLLDVNRRE